MSTRINRRIMTGRQKRASALMLVWVCGLVVVSVLAAIVEVFK